MTPGSSPHETTTWLFMRGDDIPERWRSRAVPVFLVPLVPDEAGTLLEHGTAAPFLSPDEQVLAGLVARGLPTKDVADRLAMSTRGVQRKVARLRRRLGLEAGDDLSAFLARRGF